MNKSSEVTKSILLRLTDDNYQNSEKELNLKDYTDITHNFITLIFRTSSRTNDEPIKIQCTSTDLISDVIERYRTKSEDKDRSRKFIFNAKELDQTMTVGEAGLTEGSNIFVVTTQGVYGA